MSLPPNMEPQEPRHSKSGRKSAPSPCRCKTSARMGQPATCQANQIDDAPRRTGKRLGQDHRSGKVNRTCCARVRKRSSTLVIRWCGWRARSFGISRTAGFPAYARCARADRHCRRADRGAVHPQARVQPVGRNGCARGLENRYYHFLCGIEFCHDRPFDHSSLTHWRHAARSGGRSTSSSTRRRVGCVMTLLGPPASPVPAVPEPAPLMLLGAALVGFGGFQRCKAPAVQVHLSRLAAPCGRF